MSYHTEAALLPDLSWDIDNPLRSNLIWDVAIPQEIVMESVDNVERFYQLVFPHIATVARIAKFLTRCSADADDLSQITLLKAFKSLEHHKDANNTKAWLLAILRNANIDCIRARKGNVSSLEELEDEPAEQTPWEPREEADVWKNPESAFNELSDQNIIDALHQLPKEIRWTLLLSDIEGLDERDAAAILEVPVGTIKSRLHRGREMLRSSLTPTVRKMHMPGLRDRAIFVPSPLVTSAQGA